MNRKGDGIMKCELCGKREATSVFTQTVNGSSKTVHLCSQCAQEQMMNSWLSDFGLGSFMGLSQGAYLSHTAKTCPGCGTTLEEIQRTGLVGCAKCYETFAPQLSGTIERIHGASAHVGKIPATSRSAVQLEGRISELKTRMAKAVADQNFEQAAALRDQIRDLEQQNQQDQQNGKEKAE